MDTQNTFKKTSLSTINKNSYKYQNAVKEKGFVVFKKAYYSDTEVAKILKTIFPGEEYRLQVSLDNSDGNSVDETFIKKEFDEDIGNEPYKFDSHGPERRLRAGLNVKTLTLTGKAMAVYLVDSFFLYAALTDEEKYFLNQVSVQRVPNFIDHDKIQDFINYCHSGFTCIWSSDENLTAFPSFGHKAIQTHSLTGKQMFNVCVSKLDELFNEHICLFEKTIPSKQEIEKYYSILENIYDRIEKHEFTEVNTLDEGDLLLIDLERMIVARSHTWYVKEAQIDTTYVYSTNNNVDRAGIKLQSLEELHKLNKVHNLLASDPHSGITTLTKQKKRRRQSVTR